MAVKVGIIGLKGHYSVCTGRLAQRDDCRLVGVCDDDPEKLAQVADWPAADADTRTYTDMHQMLDETQPDVVCETGTDVERATVMEACAERGIHVLCEKPLAYDLEHLARIKSSVETGGIHLSMLLTMRHDPPYLAMRQAVADGAIGKLCQASMQKSYRLGQRPEWLKDRQTFAGIIPYIGIHALDLIRYTTGQHFVSGSGYQGNIGHPEIGQMEDSACLTVQMDNGACAAVRLDYCRPEAAPTHGDDRLRLAGNKGVIETFGTEGTVTLITHDEGPRALELPEAVNQWDDFLASIYDGGLCLVPAAECYYITEVVLRLREAAEQNAVVSLPTPVQDRP